MRAENDEGGWCGVTRKKGKKVGSVSDMRGGWCGVTRKVDGG